MKTNNLLKIFSLILIIGVAIYSCEPQQINPDTATAQDDAKARGSIIDAFGFVSNNADDGGKGIMEENCFTKDLKVDEAGNRTLVIAFAETGCTINGMVYKGKITAVMTGRWINANTKMTITFEDYSRDGVKLSGTIVANIEKIEGEIPNGVPTIKVVSTGMVLTFADGKTITWNCTDEIKILEGFSTFANNADNKVQLVTSSLDGTNKAGVAFTSVSTDLLKIPTCDLVVSGTTTITKGTDITVIDFGSGDCDGKFTVTQNGISVEVTP